MEIIVQPGLRATVVLVGFVVPLYCNNVLLLEVFTKYPFPRERVVTVAYDPN